MRWLQLIERQGIEPGKHKDVAGRVERVNDSAQPLGPVVALGEENNSATARLLPLGKQMESDHAER